MSNDLISREYLKEHISELWSHDDAIDIWIKRFDVEDLIDSAPTVPQITVFCENADEKAIADMKEELQRVIDDLRPKGEWITVKQDTILGTFEVNNKVCDQCNHATKYEYPFCPWCGAYMQKGGKEE